MIADVEGKVRNTNLPTNQPLLPLFEAIQNSIEAIDDAKEENGCIEVEIIRDVGGLLQEPSTGSSKQLAPIISFIIHDNGIGFDKKNYDAFNRSDTTYKATRGGRGIGRFVWLTAFDKVEIKSKYIEDGILKQCNFTFCPRGDGIEDKNFKTLTEGKKGTTVRLNGFKGIYRTRCPKHLEIIATHIIEYFLDAFVGLKPPKIILHDKEDGEKIDLDIYFEKEMKLKSKRERINIKGESFDILHVHLRSKHIEGHKICLCANGRVVENRNLLNEIPNLPSRLLDEKREEFVYVAYVNSNYLDSIVRAERLEFKLLDDGADLLPNELSRSDILSAIMGRCSLHLSPYTEPIKREKKERVRIYIEEEGAMYRPIMKYLDPSIDDLNINATNEEIELHLYRASHNYQVTLKQEGQELLREDLSADDDLGKYMDKFRECFAKITDFNMTALANYVEHRRVVIDFFQKLLNLRDDRKYSPEEKIHNIVFPQTKTSEDVSFKENNLWLIDEKLSFHVFLASDKPISQAPLLENTSSKKPDILIFDKAIAVTDTKNTPFDSITMFEFKKPQRNDYSETENPLDQMNDYIMAIRSGSAKTREGRPIQIKENTPFYCFAVCDLTPNMHKWAKNHSLIPTPDTQGYFGFNPNYFAYYEVISYDKLLGDAKKRNKVFFDILGLA